MKNLIRISILLTCLEIAGCKSALLELKRDNQLAEERIEKKQLQLVQLEDENRQLSIQKNKLLAELDQKNITLEELNTQLNALKDANSKAKASTDAERRKRAKLSRQLEDYSEKIKTLKNDRQMSLEDKMKKSKELKKKIKDTVQGNFERY